MNLLDILTPDCIVAPLESTEKRAAIEELIDALKGVDKVHDAKSLKEAVWTREQTRTTGIGQGLAIPHGKCSGMTDLAIAIGKPSQPMDFDSIDSKPVRLIVLLASPPDRTSDHIQALARVSRMVAMDEFRERLYAAETPEEIFDLIREQQVGD